MEARDHVSRMQAVQTPIIPTVAALIRDHPGTISLGQGVVHYGPPPEAIDQISRFLADPENHKYRPVQGIPALIDALAAKLRCENGIDPASGSAVVVTAGANMAFVNALLAVTDLGDEVVLQTPYYFNHEMAITMAGCRPVPVETDDHYQLAAGSHPLRDHPQDTGRGHDLPQQPLRGRLRRSRAARGQRDLPRTRALPHQPTRPTSTSPTATPGISPRGRSREAAATPSRCSRSPKPTGSPVGASATW